MKYSIISVYLFLITDSGIKGHHSLNSFVYIFQAEFSSLFAGQPFDLPEGDRLR